MSIRKTESILPMNFAASDLGQAVEDGNCALISYLTSPIAINSKIDYVLFVRNVPETDRGNWTYNWKSIRVSDNTVINADADSDTGIFDVTPDFIGQVITSVEVIRNGATIKTLNLVQDIIPLDPGLELFLENNELSKHLNINKSIGALGGDKGPSRELINNFRRYIFDAVAPAPPKVGVDVPPRFLAAIAYASIKETPKEGLIQRDAEIGAAGAELNGETDLMSLGTQIDNALGVCSISPQALAMVVKRPSTGSTYTPWTELPSEEDKREEIRENILNNLNNLADAEAVKIDLFNLLRFPKTNILMAVMVLRKLIDRAHRWPGITSKNLIGKEDALRIIATEYNIGGTDSPLPPEVGPPAPTNAHPNEFGINVVGKLMKIPAISLYFIDSTSDGALAYGGYNLRRGDNDAQNKWDGIPNRSGPLDTVPAPGETPFVQQLQQDLAELGFKIVGLRADGTGDGDFGLKTEWAVREFQIYAKMMNIAKEKNSAGTYLDKLERSINLLPYTGSVSGVVNMATRVAIQYWKANNWRCPVIIGVYDDTGTNVINNKDNIWLHQDITTNNAKIYARDYSGYYQFSTDPNRIDSGKFRIGRYTTEAWGGPVSLWWDCWRESEILPENLIRAGANYDSLTNTEKSTFRAIRAVAENECLGFFDCITAYDRAIISTGLCHWTIALVSGTVASEGELCAYLSYLKYKNVDSFYRSFQRFGLNIDKNWAVRDPTTGQIDGTGRHMYDSGQRKYKAWVQLQDENGDYKDITKTKDEILYLNTWHWFYRFVMAGRLNESYRLKMWDMARIRIRDLLSTYFRSTDNIPKVPEGGGNRTAKIGDIFTSEEAVAMLYRWHIYSPGQVVNGGFATKEIVNAVVDANIPNAAGNPTQWNDNHEQALITALKNKVDNVKADPNDDLEVTIERVMAWPNIVGRYNYIFGNGVLPLSSSRGSFKFDGSDLPQQVD